MPRDIKLKIQRAVAAGPDMRKPQSPTGNPIPPVGRTLAYFVGYFEVGLHEVRPGIVRDRVILTFELVGHLEKKAEFPRGCPYPRLVSMYLDRGLIEGDSLNDLFVEMNFEQTASHMVEMLGRTFVVSVTHRRRQCGRGLYASLMTAAGYLAIPARLRDEATGKLLEVPAPPRTTAIRLFVWDTADADDWYDLYIPGEWPEWRDARTGELLSPACSRNFLQEKIASAKNWPEHPLYGQVQIGPDPHAPTPEELEAKRARELKEWQAGNWRELKEAMNRVLVESREGKPLRRRAKRV